MAAVPSIGRASAVESRPGAPEAELTRELYERFHRQIFNYCLHQLSSREEAEDATQTTFLNAFRGLQRGVVPELESAWLFKIANNVILTRRRSSSRRRRVETPGDLDAIQDLLPSPQRDTDELIRLTEGLAAMPEQQRKALLLREWQGLSYREIGDRLGLTQAAVETLLFRARRSLANGLIDPEAAPKRKGRLRSGLDFGSVLAGLKGLLSGGAAVKVAVTAAAVATSAVVAAEPPVRHYFKPEGPAPRLTALAAKPAVLAPAPRPVASPAAVVVAPVPARAKPAARARVAPPAPPAVHVRRRAEPVVAAPAPAPAPVAAVPVVETPQPAPVAPAPPPAAAPQPVPAAPIPAATPPPAQPQPASAGEKSKDRIVRSSEKVVVPVLLATPPAQTKPVVDEQWRGGGRGNEKSQGKSWNEKSQGKSWKVQQPVPTPIVARPAANLPAAAAVSAPTDTATTTTTTTTVSPVPAPQAVVLPLPPVDAGSDDGHSHGRGHDEARGGSRDR